MYAIRRDEEGVPRRFPALTFVSVFDGWLGPGDVHQLDEVEPDEWRKFWALNEMLLAGFDLFRVEGGSGACHPVRSAREVRGSWHADGGTDGPLVLFVPALECVYEEHHDYTNLLWHRAGAAPRPFLDLAERVGLHHFDREGGWAVKPGQ